MAAIKFPIFKVIKLLLPIIRDVISAASAKSEGGKRVTPAEVEDILTEHLDDVVTVIIDHV